MVSTARDNTARSKNIATSSANAGERLCVSGCALHRCLRLCQLRELTAAILTNTMYISGHTAYLY